jgi:predicted nucleic acid-binding protein
LILADTNTWIAYLGGSPGTDVEVLDEALSLGSTTMIPPVLSELLSDPKLPESVEKLLLQIPETATLEGYWWRAGKLRASLIGRRCKPKLADTMVAQYCLDHGATLISRDRDFRAFVRHAGLSLL